MLATLETSKVYSCQTEGQSYEKAVFQRIPELYASSFGETEINDFETEEIFPQTISMAMKVKPLLPFTLVYYTHSMDFRLTPQVVKTLANPLLAGRVKLNL